MIYPKYKKFFKVFSINIILLVLGTITIELFLKLINKEKIFLLNKYGIPKLMCNISSDYDVSHLYNSSKLITSLYQRDKECYRSKNSNSSELPIILTIGGSTTEQRFVSEGKTFQDVLDTKFKGSYDFINGGVDGQTSAGHLFSIKNWHSKALKNKEVSEIIFYIGINEVNLFLDNRLNYIPTYTFKRKAGDFLEGNSKIYRVFKGIYLSNKIPKNLNNYLAAYDGEFPFVKDNKKIEKIVSEKRSKNYEKLINDLVKASINNFPKAKIKIIQQSLPGCNYIDQYNVIDTYGTDHTPNYCRTMGEIYLSMDQAISEISPQYKSKISIHKMYLENTLKYEDVYDSVHTNNSGSRKIAEYIESLY